MELFEAIEKRRTIRDFTNEVMEDATIKKIVEAGLLQFSHPVPRGVLRK